MEPVRRLPGAPQPQYGEIPERVLPLVICPCCRVRRAVWLVSKSRMNPGRVFYKCPNHRSGNGGCNFFHWEDGEDNCVDYLSSIGVIIPCDSSGEIEDEEQKVEKKVEKNVEVEQKTEMKQFLEKIEDLIALCKMILCVFVVLVALMVYVVAHK